MHIANIQLMKCILPTFNLRNAYCQHSIDEMQIANIQLMKWILPTFNWWNAYCQHSIDRDILFPTFSFATPTVLKFKAVYIKLITFLCMYNSFDE